MVEHDLFTDTDLRDFVFTNPVRFYTRGNPQFFAGTAVEAARRTPSCTGAERDRHARSRHPRRPRRRRHRRAGVHRRRRRPRRPHRRRRRRSTSRRRARSTPTASWSRPASSTSTRTTTPRCSGIPALTPVAVPRRHHRDRRQLRLLDRAARPEHVDYVMRMMARVEGMPLDVAARPARRGTGATFGEWLDRLDGHLAVNAGFLVGHSTMRRVVMGDDATHARRPTPDQIAAMVRLAARVARRRRARVLVVARRGAHRRRRQPGAVARRRSPTSSSPCAGAVRDHAGTTLEFIPAMGEISDGAHRAHGRHVARRRPSAQLEPARQPRRRREVYEQQLTSSDHAAAQGANVVALALPDLHAHAQRPDARRSLPGWGDVLALPDAERRRARRRPATVRERLRGRLRHRAARQGARRG